MAPFWPSGYFLDFLSLATTLARCFLVNVIQGFLLARRELLRDALLDDFLVARLEALRLFLPPVRDILIYTNAK
jgi:hypothetical protein